MKSSVYRGAAIAAAVLAFQAAPASAQDNCGPADGAEFVCGVSNVEQQIYLGDSDWSLGGSTPGGPNAQAPLYFIHLDTAEVVSLDPAAVKMAKNTEAFPDCDHQPDLARLAALGLEYRVVNGRNQLLVVSHQDGHWIQAFEVDFGDGAAVPALTWIGCIGMPRETGIFADALVTLDDGSIVMTSLFDGTDPDFIKKLETSQPHGELLKWKAGEGWSELAAGQLSGPNGVIRSEDGKTLYVADWGGRGIAIYDMATDKVEKVHTGFKTDNLTWSEDGKTIFATGQSFGTDTVFACAGATGSVNCTDVPFEIVSFDPATRAVKKIFGPGVMGVMGTGTGVLQRGDRLWVNAFRSDRIARIPLPM